MGSLLYIQRDEGASGILGGWLHFHPWEANDLADSLARSGVVRSDYYYYDYFQ